MSERSGIRSVIFVAVITIAACIIGAILLSWADVFAQKTTLKIVSNPPGALVMMDGIALGQTPLEPALSKPGSYIFTLLLNGYRCKTISYPCYGDCTLMLALQRIESGVVSVETEPAGASVFINGVERGSSPLSVSLEPGKHAVTILKQNYEKFSSDITIENNETARIEATLIPALENYYKNAIEAEPDNLYFYCDLMRFYFVKERNEDLIDLISRGIDQFMKGVIDNDENARFFQEITKISNEAPDLYKTTIIPGIAEIFYSNFTNKDRKPKAFSNITGNKRTGSIMMDIVAELLTKYPDDPGCLSFILSNTVVLYTMLRKMSVAEYGEFIKSIEKAGTAAEPNAEWFAVFRQLAMASLSKRDLDLAAKYYRFAIDKYCEGVKKEEISDVYYRLAYTLVRMGMDKEVIEFAKEAESSGLVLPKQLSLIKIEATKAERKLNPKKPKK